MWTFPGNESARVEQSKKDSITAIELIAIIRKLKKENNVWIQWKLITNMVGVRHKLPT